MINLNDLKSSSIRVSKFSAAHPISALVPMFVSGAFYKGLLFCIQKLSGKHHILIESISLFLICFPLGMLAEAVLARWRSVELCVCAGTACNARGIRFGH